MSGNTKEVIIEVRLAGGQVAKKSVSELVLEISRLEKEARNLNTQLKGTNKTQALTGAAAQSAAANLAQVRTQLKANRTAFREYQSTVLGTTSAVKSQMASLATSMFSVAAAFMAVRRAITLTVKNFMEFESTLTHVQTLLDEVHEEFHEGALKIMKDYGFSIRDVNKALFDSISAMIPAGEALGFLHEASRLAIGGVTDLKTSVDGLTSIINAYQLEVGEAGRVSDAFYRAQKFGKTTVSELVENIGRVAPIAAIANVSYQDMLSTLAELTLGGLDTRESVTILRQAIAGLIKPAEGAKQVLDEFNVPTGIAAVRAAGLTYSLEKLTEAAIAYPDVIAEMIPNIRAFTGAAALTGDRLDHLNMIMEDVNTNFGFGSSLSIAYARELETLDVQAKKWNATIVAWTINLGEKLKPTLIWLMDNTPLLARMLGYVSAALLVLKLRTIALGAAFTKLWATLRANPLGLILTALSAVAAIVIELTKNYNALTSKQKEFNKELATQKFALNLLFEELKNTNTEAKRKSEIINTLNRDYKDYIKNLIKEGDALEELTEKQLAANSALQQALALRYRETETTEAKQGVERAAVKATDVTKMTAANIPGFGPEQEAILYNQMVQIANDLALNDEQFGDTRAAIDSLKDKFYELLKALGATDAQLKITKDNGESFYGLVIVEAADATYKLADATREYNTQMKEAEAYYNKMAEFNAPTKEELDERAIGMGEFRKVSPDRLEAEIQKVYKEIDEDTEDYRRSLREKYVQLLEQALQYNKTIVEDTKESKKERERIDKEAADLQIEIYKSLTDEQIGLIRQYEFYLFKSMQSRIKNAEKLTESEINELAEAKKKYYTAQLKAEKDYQQRLRAIQMDARQTEVASMPDTAEKEIAVAGIDYDKKMEAVRQMHEDELAIYRGYVDKRLWAQEQADEKYRELLEQSAEYEKALVEEKERRIAEITMRERTRISHMIRETDPRYRTDEVYRLEADFTTRVDALYEELYLGKIQRAEFEARLHDILLDKKLQKEQLFVKSNQMLVDEELLSLTYLHNQKLISEEQFQIRMKNLRYKYTVSGRMEEYAEELRLLRDKYEKEEMTYEEYLKRKAELQEEYGVKATEAMSDPEKAWKEFAAEKAQETSDQLFQFWAEHDARMTEQRLNALQDRYDGEQELLSTRLQNGLITEQDYLRKKAASDAKMRKEEEKIKKEQWKREKRRSITQVIVNGIIAVMKSWATGGFPAGIGFAAAMAGITAALTAAVTAAADKYALGGIGGDGKGAKAGIAGGKPHSAGGTHLYGTDGSHYEIERGELFAVVNKRDTATLANLSNINSKHGKRFADGGIGGNIALPQYNTPSVEMDVAKMLSKMKIVVDVDEIASGLKNRAEVREMARL